MRKPTKKGQKYIGSGGDILTVESFSGANGIPYASYQDAVDNNSKGHINIKNKENNGFTEYKYCFLYKNGTI